ncbi:uncharacterized protein K441DRAFT_653219 [Cenococcum geophilum 1.58]|uniref:uncharacterized protein n=1 Tax=Cenococcum geophilum 1.58 TaxID=794803 RepID=UPI00358F465A|nr:hypothetical protein K441DRAFT_653219 [Cenococcum geophilum 1.58]
MALGDDAVVRLIVWEGQLRTGPIQQRQIKVYSDQLKSSINESLEETQWRYQMWKTYPSETDGNYKLEVRLRHPKISETSEKSDAIHELCSRLLHSALSTKLRLLNPVVTFTFCPSREGTQNELDKTFARCFSTAIVTRYCVGDTLSKELERLRDDFLNRNSTKFLYQPMVVIYNAADLIERYGVLIEKMLTGIELLNGGAIIEKELIDEACKFAGGKLKSKLRPKENSSAVNSEMDGLALTDFSDVAALKIGDDTPHSSKNAEQNKEAMKLLIAIACWLTRAFRAYAPDIKKQLGPKLKELNGVVIRSKLTLASQAYLSASKHPIIALEHLHSNSISNSRRATVFAFANHNFTDQESPTIDDIAMTINSFGNLMQSTLPLFDVTLTISDAEFTSITALAAAAGVSGIATVSAAVWTLCSAAGALGPVGLLGGAAVATVAFSAAAIVEGVKWGDRQKTNRMSSDFSWLLNRQSLTSSS